MLKKTWVSAMNRVLVWLMTCLWCIGIAGLTQTTAAIVDSAGTVTTLAGTPGVIGSADGIGAAAQFYVPSGITTDSAGNLYVADQVNHTIRKITPAGTVTTLAGTAGVSGSADGIGAAAQFRNPFAIVADAAGNLYVADAINSTIRRITPAGAVTTLAGTAGSYGVADGSGPTAQFNVPQGITADAAGNLYVVDSGNATIRKITPAGAVSTLAGTPGVTGSADGIGAAARFLNPIGITADTGGNLYVADTVNHTIRKITPTGVVTTLAGTAGLPGSADGTIGSARFNAPTGITADQTGNLYVFDFNNFAIRKITPAGVVTTLAGTAGVTGTADGSLATALFGGGYGITADAAGDLYVAESQYNTIRKIMQSSVPIIANLSPNSGSVGAPLFIQGSYFGAQQNTSTVSVCGASPTVTKWSDTLIALAVPNFPAGTVCNVRVSTSQGEAVPAQYTITILTSVSGRVVNQNGDPLGGVTVLLGGPVSKTISTTPNGQYLVSGIPSGDYIATLYRTGYQFTPSPKTVSVNGVVDVTGVNFVGSAIMPALTKINPDHQKDVALPVILSGTGFGSRTLGSKVLFGGIEARINSWSDTSIEVVPPFLPASVLVQVITSAGKSNYLAFQYPTKNLNVAYSLENPVKGLVNGVYPLLPIVSNVSSTPFTVIKDISVTNPTQTWYVLYVQKFGNVTGVAVESGGVLIGPGETLPIGRVAFQSKSSLRVYVNRDAFPNCAGVIDCARQTRLIQAAQAGEVFWRLIAGSPFPVSDDAKALLVGLPVWSNLAFDTSKLLQGDIEMLFSIPNDVLEILGSPEIIVALSANGVLPLILFEAILMYRAGLVVQALAETLIYPHSGAIVFDAK